MRLARAVGGGCAAWCATIRREADTAALKWRDARGWKSSASASAAAYLAGVADRITNPTDLERRRAAARTLDEQLQAAQPEVLDAAVHAFLRCSLELSAKAPLYATLLALLMRTVAKGVEFVGRFLGAFLGTLHNVLREGEAARARRMLRFMAELVNANVLNAKYFMHFLIRLVQGSHAEHQIRPKLHARKRFLADIALSCLPWCGSALVRLEPELLHELTSLSNSFRQIYMASQEWSFLRPMKPDGVNPSRTRQPDASVPGAVHCEDRLLLVFQAVDELSNNNWECAVPLKPYRLFEAELANGMTLEPPTEISIPPHSRTSRYSAAEFLFHFDLSPAEEEEAGDKKRLSLAMEKLVISDYVCDILDNFGANYQLGVERFLQIPTPYYYKHRVVETVLSTMLALPRSKSPLVYYGVSLAHACRVRGGGVPFPLMNCTEQLYLHCAELDAEVFDRFAEWFAYHLNNFQFQWNWEDWVDVTEDKADDANRGSHARPFKALFVKMVLDRLTRHASLEEIKGILPEELHPLLPPKPEPDLDMFGQDPQVQSLRGIITGKGKLELDQVRAELYEATARSNSVYRFCLLVKALLLGSMKTYSHFDIISERYMPLLRELALAAGETGQAEAISIALRFWRNSAQNSCFILNRFNYLGIIPDTTTATTLVPVGHSDMDPNELQAMLYRFEVWEYLREIVLRNALALDRANREVTIAAYAANHATEGEAEAALAALDSARSAQEQCRVSIQNILLVVLSQLFALYAVILRSLPENNSSRAVLVWRVRGMIIEFARKTPDTTSAILPRIQYAQDLVELQRCIDELHVISECNILE
ncbi:Nuclear cap-binding protein subunit 1 [Porphyridium purpureum]|uniref:Nuclear cap-binding protein subunit 1 n=1 Tax=Porphyridium purpureum TaxID=35688 RepID=A0A5J4YWY1_PORPP|nr:Nuclear cap-binding protein subunit 1 [Porphyridium purpureum]|eukprot:POR8949..scf227_4